MEQTKKSPGNGQGIDKFSNTLHYTDPAAEFYSSMIDAGIIPRDRIPGDGQLHRFHVEGDTIGTRNGWAVLHLDGVPSGAYGTWKTGSSFTWCAKRNLTPAEKQEHRRRMEVAKAVRDEDAKQRRKHAADRAAFIWNETTSPSHPYLIAKRVQPYSARQRGTALVLPVIDFSGQLTSLQFIDSDGSKRLLSGGKKRGCFIPVSSPDNSDRVLICEGWATGATLAELEPTARVIAAIDAGNLEPVATQARMKWPNKTIVICADNDPVGRTKGKAAAIAAGALFAVPEFPPGAEGSDFNDLVTSTAGGSA